MSYDLYFKKDNEVCLLEDEAPRGGTFSLNGSNEAWLSITFNYAKVYSKYNFGIISHDEEGEEFLNGKTAKACIEILDRVIPRLGDNVNLDNYWEATEGNAKLALLNVRKLASEVPEDAICEVYA